MQALIAILIGALILAALAYSIGRLITPLESRWPPLARLWVRRAALEEAERWCVGLRTHDRIGAAAYPQRMSGLARGQRTLPRGGRDG